jgi:threonine/homoserine efflux transporter RhtA
MLVGEPVVAVLLGVVILGEHLVVRGAGAAILAVAVGAMTVATIALGRDSASPDHAAAKAAQPEIARNEQFHA